MVLIPVPSRYGSTNIKGFQFRHCTASASKLESTSSKLTKELRARSLQIKAALTRASKYFKNCEVHLDNIENSAVTRIVIVLK